MTTMAGIAIGAAGALAARALTLRALLFKFRRDVRSINAGDYGPLLAGYADDAILHFHEGDHRWSGVHRGKPAIERFLRDFVAAGLRGEIVDAWMSGPPWALTIVARFDDEARGSDGERIYGNRVVLLLRTRWGKVVEHEDFYMDTGRIEDLERRLREAGVEPAEAVAGAV